MRPKPSSFSRLRSLSQSKKGVAGIFFAVWAVYVVIHDFLDFLRDVSYAAKHVGPVLSALIGVLNFLIGALNFLTTGVGNLVAIALAVIFIWWALRTQPDQLNSGNVATAQTNAAEDAAQRKTELDEAKQEIERLRIELNNRPPRRFDTPVEIMDTLTPGRAREIEEEKQRLNAKIEELEAKLAEAQQTIHELREDQAQRGPRHFGEVEATTIDVLTPAKAKEMEELKAKNMRLQEQIEKAAIEAGLPPNVATERRIANCDFRIHDLLKLAGKDSVIEGKEFENCTIRGPATITTARPPRTPEKRGGRDVGIGVYHTPTLYVEGNRDSVLREVPSGGATASGVIHLVDCSYKVVRLSGIVIVGNANELNWWREHITFSGSDE